MSYTPEDFKQIRFTAALELMRHKMLIEVAKHPSYASLDVDEVNEILVVAGLPVIMPEELNVKEVDVIKTENRREHDTQEGCPETEVQCDD